MQVAENHIDMVNHLVMNGADVKDKIIKHKLPPVNLNEMLQKREVGYRIIVSDDSLEEVTTIMNERTEVENLERSRERFGHRISVYRGHPVVRKQNRCTEAGKLIMLPGSLTELKNIAGEKFGFDASNAIVTDEEGSEIDCIDVIRDKNKIFVGENPGLTIS